MEKVKVTKVNDFVFSRYEGKITHGFRGYDGPKGEYHSDFNAKVSVKFLNTVTEMVFKFDTEYNKETHTSSEKKTLLSFLNYDSKILKDLDIELDFTDLIKEYDTSKKEASKEQEMLSTTRLEKEYDEYWAIRLLKNPSIKEANDIEFSFASKEEWVKKAKEPYYNKPEYINAVYRKEKVSITYDSTSSRPYTVDNGYGRENTSHVSSPEAVIKVIKKLVDNKIQKENSAKTNQENKKNIIKNDLEHLRVTFPNQTFSSKEEYHSYNRGRNGYNSTVYFFTRNEQDIKISFYKNDKKVIYTIAGISDLTAIQVSKILEAIGD